MELTDLQKRKIEESRAKAMEILAAKKLVKSHLLCQFQNEGENSVCSSSNIDSDLYESFGELVCSVCKLHNENFDLMTKSDSVIQYLVTDDSLTTLKYKTRNNPHNPGWTPMKLYLRKHVHALSMKRFGSEEKLAEEKKLRESQKYDRFLQKTSDIMTTSTQGLREELSNRPEEGTNKPLDYDADSKRKRGGKAITESQKRKKMALGSLVGIIRGDTV